MSSLRRALRPLALVILVAALGRPALAQDDASPRPVPPYQVPDVPRTSVPTGALAAAVTRAITTLSEPRTPEAAAEAARLLAGVGEGALPEIAGALPVSPWFTRAALIGAVAEMDTHATGGLLRAAAFDPSFAVREAAVGGLGKIGGAADAAVLLVRAMPEHEPAWRVRVAATTALRRAALRGVVDRSAAESVLTHALADPDPDVRRAALGAIVPLGADDALDALLELYDSPESSTEERALALSALRMFRDQPQAVLPTLRHGLLETDDPEAAAAAGAALVDLGGRDVLDDSEVAWALVRQLGDAGSPAIRAALARIGPDVVPWLRGQVVELARRIASHRIEHQVSPIEFLVETLLEVRREAGFEVVRDLALGAQAEVLAPPTRRFALRKIHVLFAPRLGVELRRAFDGHGGDDVRRELLLAIEASGGDDLAERLDAALAHPDGEARSTALDLLTRRPDLPAGPVLRRLARDPETPLRQRELALEALGRRDPSAAAEIARSLLDHPHFDVRERAAERVAAAADPSDAPAIVRRLEVESGDDARTAHASAPPDDGAAITPSAAAPDRAQRRRVRRALLTALVAADPVAAKPALVTTLSDEEDSALRERAAHLLRDLVDESDAPLLFALLEEESTPEVRTALLTTLATLGDSARVTDHFDALLRASGRRWEALTILRSRDSTVRPIAALTEGLEAADWDDDARETALVLLEREGIYPPADALIAIALGAHERSLAAEALRVAGTHRADAAGPLLVGLVRDVTDLDKLAMVAEQLGRMRFEPAVPALLVRLDALRSRALFAPRATDADVEAYRRVAVALGRSGTEEAGRALVRHVLSPETARAVAAYSRRGNGPFQISRAPAVSALRGLISAFCHLDEATCTRLVAARLGELAESGAHFALGEDYIDGVARYLRDPEAYEGLPPRRRPAAALPLMRLVVHSAPRLSPLDLEMQRYVRDQLESEQRYDEALEAHAAVIALADVEEAWRPPERRLYELGKETSLRALALAARGAGGEAEALLRGLRARAPTNGDLAYYAGQGLTKLGITDDATLDALRHAVAVDESDARAQLWLGWALQARDGATAGIPHYEEALRLDRKAVREAGGDYRTNRRGKTHRWSYYPYWLARALAAAGRGDEAVDMLSEAIAHDDRVATQALGDAAFANWDDLKEIVDGALGALRDSD